MELFKIKLETTNAMNNTACDKNNKNYIDVENGYIYVTKRDFEYVVENYKWLSIEVVGYVFERPCELAKGE